MGQVVPNSGPYSAHAMHCYTHPCKAWPPGVTGDGGGMQQSAHHRAAHARTQLPGPTCGTAHDPSSHLKLLVTAEKAGQRGLVGQLQEVGGKVPTAWCRGGCGL